MDKSQRRALKGALLVIKSIKLKVDNLVKVLDIEGLMSELEGTKEELSRSNEEQVLKYYENQF